jgi:hypothetical protein
MAVVNPSCDTFTGWAMTIAHGVLQLNTLNRLSLDEICKSEFVF